MFSFACSCYAMFDVIVYNPFTLEYVKPWQGISYCIKQNLKLSFLRFGIGVINVT